LIVDFEQIYELKRPNFFKQWLM